MNWWIMLSMLPGIRNVREEWISAVLKKREELYINIASCYNASYRRSCCENRFAGKICCRVSWQRAMILY